MPYKLSSNGKCVVKSDTGETVPGGCHDTDAQAHAHLSALNIAYAREHGHNIPEKSAAKETTMSRFQDWLSSAFKQVKPDNEAAEKKPDDEAAEKSSADDNNMPASHFLYVEPGKDTKDARHLPYKTADGSIDLPRLRNALSRLGQSATGHVAGESWLTDSLRNSLRAKAEGILKSHSDGDKSSTKAVSADFTVFKQASGKYRWVGVTTSGFRDRDKQIVTTKALQSDVERMNKDKVFGDLAWWHVEFKENDPQTRNPGVALDIANCDLSEMVGSASNLESGEFMDDEVGAAFEKNHKDIGFSIDFWHPASEPDAQGNFNQIHRFRRTALPREYASNLMGMSSLTVTKELKMEDKLARFKTIVGDAKADEIIKSIEAREKALESFGVEKKEVEPATLLALIETKTKEATANLVTTEQLMQALKDYHEALTKSQSKERDELKATVTDLSQKVTTLWGDAPNPLKQEVHNAQPKQTTLTAMEAMIKEKQGQGKDDAEPLSPFTDFAFGKNGK